MMPTPPSWAIAIASRPSVTVSMAADSRGIFREILRVTCVFRLVSRGRTLENAGTRSTSSNVSAFWIRRMANPMGAKPNYTDSSPDFHCPNSSLRGVPHFLPQFTGLGRQGDLPRRFGFSLDLCSIQVRFCGCPKDTGGCRQRSRQPGGSPLPRFLTGPPAPFNGPAAPRLLNPPLPRQLRIDLQRPINLHPVVIDENRIQRLDLPENAHFLHVQVDLG